MCESNAVSANGTLAALFYVMNLEMAKTADEMNVSLASDCAEAAIRLDPRLAPDGEKIEALKEKLRSASAAKPKRLSRTAKILIIAAALLVIAGMTVYSFLTSDDYAIDSFIRNADDFWKYEDGVTYTHENDDLTIVYTEDTQFRSLDALLADLGRDVEVVNDETGKIVFTEAVKTHRDGKTLSAMLYYRCGDTPVSLCISFDKDLSDNVQYPSVTDRYGNGFFIDASGSSCSGYSKIDGVTYSISSPDYDAVVAVIDALTYTAE